MHIDRLTKKYARALYRHAAKRDDQQRVLEDLRALSDALQAQPEFRAFLENPEIPADAKSEKLRELIATDGEILQTTNDFIRLVVKNGRPEVLPPAAESFLEEWDDDRGVKRAHVRTARPLSSEHQADLKEALERLVDSEVVLDIEQDADLIAGFSVRIGDQFFDGTLKERFERITEAVARRKQKAR